MPPPITVFIDEDKVASMAYCQCRTQTIARVLGVDDDTLRLRCSGLMTRKRSEGRAALLATQFKQAFDGDRTMLVWLGKNYLGQTDRAEIEIRAELIQTRVVFADRLNKIAGPQGERALEPPKPDPCHTDKALKANATPERFKVPASAYVEGSARTHYARHDGVEVIGGPTPPPETEGIIETGEQIVKEISEELGHSIADMVPPA